MSTPYLGEIRISGFAFAPKGWALCNGQLLPIAGRQIAQLHKQSAARLR